MVVVVAILAMVASLAIPLVSGIMDRSQSSVQATSVNEAARTVETYFNLHQCYPDSWDTLINADDDFYSRLHPSLTGGVLAGASKATLSTNQFASMELVRITNIQHHDEDPLIRPSESGTLTGALSTSKVVRLNKSSTSSVPYLLLHDDFNLSGSQIAQHDFVVFGFGPRNRSVGQIIQQAPLLESLAPGLYYSRSLVIFAVPSAGVPVKKAAFIGAIGPDGRSLRASLNAYNTPISE